MSKTDTDDKSAIGLTGMGLLLTTILLPHEEGDKIERARELVARRLYQNGLRQRDLVEFKGLPCDGLLFLQSWVAISQFIQVLHNDTLLAAKFVEWVYLTKGFWSDEDSFWVLEKTKQGGY